MKHHPITTLDMIKEFMSTAQEQWSLPSILLSQMQQLILSRDTTTIDFGSSVSKLIEQGLGADIIEENLVVPCLEILKVYAGSRAYRYVDNTRLQLIMM